MAFEKAKAILILGDTLGERKFVYTDIDGGFQTPDFFGYEKYGFWGGSVRQIGLNKKYGVWLCVNSLLRDKIVGIVIQGASFLTPEGKELVKKHNDIKEAKTPKNA